MRRLATMKQAQAECRRLRAFSDANSHEQAAKIEREWRDHPDYESDRAWLLRVQGGR